MLFRIRKTRGHQTLIRQNLQARSQTTANKRSTIQSSRRHHLQETRTDRVQFHSGEQNLQELLGDLAHTETNSLGQRHTHLHAGIGVQIRNERRLAPT